MDPRSKSVSKSKSIAIGHVATFGYDDDFDVGSRVANLPRDGITLPEIYAPFLLFGGSQSILPEHVLRIVFTRNPNYWKVNTEGDRLPYT